jgi:hypothetical protein
MKTKKNGGGGGGGTPIFNNDVTSYQHTSNGLNRLCEVMTVAEKNSAIHFRQEDPDNSRGRDSVCFFLRDEAAKTYY